MADRKRRSDDDRFLGTHFTSTGELSVNDNIRGAGPDTLKHVLVENLLEGETVTKALKRLRPTPKQVGNKKRRQIGGSQRHRAANAALEADAFLTELEGNAEEKAREEEIKKRAFNQVTEAASELMELGYEDIYTDTREAIQASARGGAASSQHKSMYVWHDDGMSVPCKRDMENDITSFKDLPRSSGNGPGPGPTQGVPAPENDRGARQHEPAQQAHSAAVPSGARDDREASAAIAAAGAVSYQSAVPFQYPEPKQPQQAKHLAVPKMAPLPPPPGDGGGEAGGLSAGGFRDQTPSGQPGSQPLRASQPDQQQGYAAYAQPGYPLYPPQDPGQYGGPYVPQEQWQYPMQGQPQQPSQAYPGQYTPYPPYYSHAWQ